MEKIKVDQVQSLGVHHGKLWHLFLSILTNLIDMKLATEEQHQCFNN